MRQRKRIKAKGIQTVTANEKYLLRVLNINVKFWKTYEMIGESKMLYGIEIWTVKGVWKYTDGIQGGYFKESRKKSKESKKCGSRMGAW